MTTPASGKSSIAVYFLLICSFTAKLGSLDAIDSECTPFGSVVIITKLLLKSESLLFFLEIAT
jgi:hypothetical protein